MTKEGRWVKRLAIIAGLLYVVTIAAWYTVGWQFYGVISTARDIAFVLLVVAIIRWWWKRRRGTATPVAAARGRKTSSAGLPAWLARVTPDDDWGRR